MSWLFPYVRKMYYLLVVSLYVLKHMLALH